MNRRGRKGEAFDNATKKIVAFEKKKQERGGVS